MSFYFPILWATMIGGLIPGGYFIVTFRPRLSRLGDGVDAGGWAIVIMLLYVRSVIMLLLGARIPEVGAGVVNVAFGAAVDALLWLRAVRWHRLRRDVKQGAHPFTRSTD